MIQRLLEKIAWRTRRLRLGISLFTIEMGDSQGGWGIRILEVKRNLRSYSFFAFEFRLPNKTSVQRFTVDDWDFLYLSYPLYRRYDSLSDRKLWSNNLSTWDEIQLVILKRLF